MPSLVDSVNLTQHTDKPNPFETAMEFVFTPTPTETGKALFPTPVQPAPENAAQAWTFPGQAPLMGTTGMGTTAPTTRVGRTRKPQMIVRATEADVADPVEGFSLFKLSQEERDNLLATMVFVDKPKLFECYDIPLPMKNGNDIVFNYSKFFESLSEKSRSKVPNVANLRTGDLLKMDDYRGCGSHYVVWLHRDLVIPEDTDDMCCVHDPNEDENLDINDQLADMDDYPDDPITSPQDPLAATQNPCDKFGMFPILAARQSDGAHNDGHHECYLFKHPDEYGYATPTVVSSVHYMYYYECTDQTTGLIDPLLTHSKSVYGQLIKEVKEGPDMIDDALFPLHYVGYCDRDNVANFTSDKTQWMPATGHFYRHHVHSARSLLACHFEVIHYSTFNNTVLK
jgi:hypothetical protein